MDNVHVMLTPKESSLVRRIASDLFIEFCPAREAGQISKEELYHHGIIGLLEAKSRYDKSRGVPWLAFAAFRIRGAMIDQIRVQPMIRLPQEKQKRVKLLKQAESELALAGRTVDTNSLADTLGWTVHEVHAVAFLSPSIVPVNDGPGYTGDEDGYQGETLTDSGPDPEHVVLKRELADVVNTCLESLTPPQDRLVLVGRILEGLKLKELAETLSCSMENVRQRQKRAEEKMKTCMENHGWTGQWEGGNQ